MATVVNIVSITEVVVEYLSVFPVSQLEESLHLGIRFSVLDEVYSVRVWERLVRLW